MNRLKTLILLATLTALLMWVGQLAGGTAGLWFALVFAGAMNIGAYWFADRIVLRMHHAREVTPGEAPELYATVRELTIRADLPMPKLYVIPEEAPNAFATGRNPSKGVVAVTEGLLRGLDRQEVAAVIAHELGHIKNRDTLIMAIAATFAGALSMLANAAMFGSLFGGGRSDDEDGHPLAGLLGVMLAPIAATLVQMSISRSPRVSGGRSGGALHRRSDEPGERARQDRTVEPADSDALRLARHGPPVHPEPV
jgi:heat shock protein HtpX